MNQTGQEHPPLVSVPGRIPGKICLTGSTCGFVCRRPNSSLIHLVQAQEITDGMVTLNKYVKDFDKLDWINPAACLIAAKAAPGPLDGR